MFLSESTLTPFANVKCMWGVIFGFCVGLQKADCNSLLLFEHVNSYARYHRDMLLS